MILIYIEIDMIQFQSITSTEKSHRPSAMFGAISSRQLAKYLFEILLISDSPD